MSSEAPRVQAGAGQQDDTVPARTGQPPDPADAAAEDTPSQQRATAPWVQAADACGTLRAKREMPEPDSLGG